MKKNENEEYYWLADNSAFSRNSMCSNDITKLDSVVEKLYTYTLRTTLQCTIMVEGKSTQSQRTVTHTSAATMRSRFRLFFSRSNPLYPRVIRAYRSCKSQICIMIERRGGQTRPTYCTFTRFIFQEYNHKIMKN